MRSYAMIKRGIAVTLIAAACFLTACSSGKEKPTETEKPASAQTEVTTEKKTEAATELKAPETEVSTEMKAPETEAETVVIQMDVEEEATRGGLGEDDAVDFD